MPQIAPLVASAEDSPLYQASESSFLSHIGTNYAPADAELVELGKIITSGESTVSRIQGQINALTQQIAQLKGKMQPILDSVVQHKALAHPIRRLPTEILQHIFAHCASTDIPGSMHIEDCPMVLTSVCKRWRDIALNTPWLWSTIHLPLPPRNAVNHDDLIYARRLGLEQWLSRATPIPLSFTLYQPSDPHHRARDSLDDIFPILRSRSHDWQYIHLQVPWESLQMFTQLKCSETPLLETLAINVSFDSWTGPDTPRDMTADGLFQSPKLKHFFFHGMTINAIFLEPLAIWGQLATLAIHVYITGINPEQFMRIIGSAPQLETLYLSIYSSTAQVPPLPTGRTVTLQQLKKLYIREYATYRPFQTGFRFPALEELECYHTEESSWGSPLGGASDSDVSDKGCLLSLVEHSGHGIRSLTFNPSSYTTAEMIRIISHCPQLRSLSIRPRNDSSPSNSDEVNQEFLFALKASHPMSSGTVGELPLCSHVTSLAFETQVGFTRLSLLQWIKSVDDNRTEGVEKLERLSVQFWDEDAPDLSAEIASYFPSGKGTCILGYQPPRGLTSLREGGVECHPPGGWISLG